MLNIILTIVFRVDKINVIKMPLGLHIKVTYSNVSVNNVFCKPYSAKEYWFFVLYASNCH